MIETGLRDSHRLASLLADAEMGLDIYVRERPFRPVHKLPPRVSGTGAVYRHPGHSENADDDRAAPGTFFKPARTGGQAIEAHRFERLSGIIDRFWRQPIHQQSDTWCEHRDINSVMLATSLAPDGYLILRK